RATSLVAAGQDARPFNVMAGTRPAMPRVADPSQPGCIGRPPRVGAAVQHARLLVGDDRAHRAGLPGPVRPPRDFVAEAAERLAGRLRDPAFQVEPAWMIGMRLERGGKAV